MRWSEMGRGEMEPWTELASRGCRAGKPGDAQHVLQTPTDLTPSDGLSGEFP